MAVDDYTRARERMVQEQLMGRDVQDPLVLAAMQQVPRHLFVEESLRDQAYEDHPLPIGEGQTISSRIWSPIWLRSSSWLKASGWLDVGTGSGYLAAVLAEQGAEIYSIEFHDSLATRARTVLHELGYHNISVRIGDGTLGWEEEAPFDAIVVSAASPGLPRPLLAQLRMGGRLVVPMGEEDLQTLVCIWKEPSEMREEYWGECRFVKLQGQYGWESA